MDSFNIDRDRNRRLGFPEIIYGAGKSAKVIVDILHDYRQRGENALVTKLQPEKGETLLQYFPDAFFDLESGIFLLQLNPLPPADPSVAIIAGGTSDLFVVNEVYYTLHYLGVAAERVVDVGVSGLHRLTDRLEHLQTFKILVVVAGFEAALASVVGGLFPQPIIGVPTSVGYGVAAGGSAALSSMLASCANGIMVVNIDNGYGAAIAAVRMLNSLTPTP